jgi:hypothetical protein
LEILMRWIYMDWHLVWAWTNRWDAQDASDFQAESDWDEHMKWLCKRLHWSFTFATTCHWSHLLDNRREEPLNCHGANFWPYSERNSWNNDMNQAYIV